MNDSIQSTPPVASLSSSTAAAEAAISTTTTLRSSLPPYSPSFSPDPSASRRNVSFSSVTSKPPTGSASRVNEDDEALDEIRRYESFSTVDWIIDSTRERHRLAKERQAASEHFTGHSHLANGEAVWGHSGFGRAGIPPRWWSRGPWGRRAWLMWGIVKSALSAFTDSGVIVLVGILIGLNMGVIGLATEWASDLKQGYCKSGWWLNQKFCCWEMMDPAGPGGAALPAAAKAIMAAPTTVTANATAIATATFTVTASAITTPTMVASLAALTARAIHNDLNNTWTVATTFQSNHQHHPHLDYSFYDYSSSSPQLWPRSSNEIFRDGLGTGLGLLGRAEPAKPGKGADLSETCTDWVPWSKWTLPAWLIYILFAVLLSAACAHLVRAFAPYAAGSGISEIKCILAGFVINGYLGFWTLAIKSLTLPLAIASGLSVGKEGPAVHVACCIGNVVASYFRSFNRSHAKMRELLTASSAAGVAVAFGSPIGGVLFSLEEMAHNFPASTMWRSFLCALAATVTLSFMNPFRTGKLVLFQVSYDRDWHYFEIFFFIIIGIFGGLYGAFVIKYNLQVQSFRRNNLAQHGVAEVIALAALTAIVGYANKFLRIDMTETLEILFRECEGGGDYDNLCQSWAQWRMVNSLLLATVLRTVLVILSYGCKVPAGIFVPSMAIGATFGRMVGILVKALYNTFPTWSLFSACQPDVPCITPGTYAFLGAAAALAGVTRITVAVVVIMFELTGALTYILPTMIVVGITKGVSDWFGKGGIADQVIKLNGYPFLDKDDHSFGIPVEQVMKSDPQVLPSDGIRLSELEKKLDTASYRGFPVVQSLSDPTLLGYAGKMELRYAISKTRKTRNLSADTLCLFTIEREAKQADGYLDEVPSNQTTAAADQSARDEVIRRLSRRAGNGDGGNNRITKTERQRQESQNLIGQSFDSSSNLYHPDPNLIDELEEEDYQQDDKEEDGEDESNHIGISNQNTNPIQTGIDGNLTTDVPDIIELAGWIDSTPLIVQPAMPLETVMDLFKKMGPRVILVAKHGILIGLVTVKDVLKCIALQEKQAAHHLSQLPTTTATVTTSSSEEDGDLEMLLKEVYDWFRDRYSLVSPHVDRFRTSLGFHSFTLIPSRNRSRYRPVHHDNEDDDDQIPLQTTRSHSSSSSRVPRSSLQQQHESTSFILGDE